MNQQNRYLDYLKFKETLSLITDIFIWIFLLILYQLDYFIMFLTIFVLYILSEFQWLDKKRRLEQLAGVNIK